MNISDDPLATIDAKELEADIDKAIDELFVQKGEASKDATPQEEESESPEPPAEAEKAEAESVDSQSELLEGLKESLLSLDWEITPENIDKFAAEARKLQDKLANDRHSLAVVKMSIGVCKYLKATKNSASAISIQFLHAATRTLDLFQNKPAISAAEQREALDKLLSKFRRVKADAQRLKSTAGEAVEKEAVVEAAAVEDERAAVQTVPSEAEEKSPEKAPDVTLVAEQESEDVVEEEEITLTPEEEMQLVTEDETGLLPEEEIELSAPEDDLELSTKE
ncbi:MAG: hypothetical protein JRJ12_14200, partial [Deltaproteobacteria bacterium]|nr:hypothetical protein [Deltaproteobacteria bacterium]